MDGSPFLYSPFSSKSTSGKAPIGSPAGGRVDSTTGLIVVSGAFNDYTPLSIAPFNNFLFGGAVLDGFLTSAINPNKTGIFKTHVSISISADAANDQFFFGVGVGGAVNADSVQRMEMNGSAIYNININFMEELTAVPSAGYVFYAANYAAASTLTVLGYVISVFQVG